MNANTPHLATDAIDNTIDRALSTLRDAQPRPGLNSRILTNLEHRTTVLGGPSLRKAKGWGSARENGRLTAHIALWAATSAALLAIASMMVLHHRAAPSELSRTPKGPVILSEASRSDAKSKNPDMARATTNPEPLSTTNLTQITQTVSSRPEHRSLAAMRSGETCISNRHDTGCPVHDNSAVVVMSGGTTPTDAQALADLHAPSHPAPPLPLSPQEKALLRMLRRGNAVEIASLSDLDPTIRAARDAQEAAAFHAFFPDPPPIPQPDGDTE